MPMPPAALITDSCTKTALFQSFHFQNVWLQPPPFLLALLLPLSSHQCTEANERLRPTRLSKLLEMKGRRTD